SGGLSVSSASLDSVTRTVVVLGTSAQSPSGNYTLTINGVADRFGNVIATNTTIALNPNYSVPIIAAQPQPQTTYLGSAATFSVGVSSALPVTNQWFKGSSPMAGETNASLTLNNVQSADVANYSVVVGNSNGTTSSDPALLTLLTPGDFLKWRAILNSGVWDTGTSANWINASNGQAEVFNPGDQVLFDDAFGAPTTVAVNGTVSPALITVSSSTNQFTISGAGTISGPGRLVKMGTSAFTISSGGNFTGPVTISGGSVYAGNNSFNSVASVTVTNASTLDFGGGSLTGNKRITVSGPGLNGQGALFNSYASYPLETVNIVMTGDTKFGGSSRWDLGSGSRISGAHALTLDWSAGAGYCEWNATTIAADVAGIILTNGNIGMKQMDTAFENPGTLFTVSANCQLVFYTGGWNGSIHVRSGGLVRLWTSPSPFNGSQIVLDDGAQLESTYN